MNEYLRAIRDYQGNVEVNRSIRETLISDTLRKIFGVK